MTVTVIHKFTANETTTRIPRCVRVLSAGLQDGQPMLWAEIDRCCENTVTVEGEMTGAQLPVGARFVGTVVGIDGWIVAHFFARGELEREP